MARSAAKSVKSAVPSASRPRTAGAPARRRKPPQYAYDGLTGAWLKLPWWLHLGFAAASWPACVYLAPRLPAHEPWVQRLLTELVPQWGWPVLIAFFVGSAIASAIKAARQPRAKPPAPRRRKATDGEPRVRKPRAAKPLPSATPVVEVAEVAEERV